MRVSSSSIFALALSLVAVAGATLSPYNLHEKRYALPDGWTHARRHEPSAVLPMRFAIKQRNIEDIGDHLMEVSDPRSPKYGKHWTAGQVMRMYSPSDESVQVVREWLIQSGLEPSRIRVTATKGWIEVNATVQEVEYLLQAQYNVYEHPSGKSQIACESYHLPAHVQPHIDFVTPTVNFAANLKRLTNTNTHNIVSTPKIEGSILQTIIGELDQCDEYITPVCVRTLYDLFYTPVSADKNSIGIAEYSPNIFRQKDLDIFFANYSPSLTDATPVVVGIDGGFIPLQGDQTVEANLDLQYSMTLVTAAQNVTEYQVGDFVEGASFDNLLDAIDGSFCTYEGGDNPYYDGIYPDTYPGGYNGTEECGTVKPAYVISTSYAGNEADLSYAYYARQCSEYAKLGLMGITVLYASGDYGVAGYGGVCLANDGFNPMYPASCPYVTAVGATMIPTGNTVYQPEVAAYVPSVGFYSGGGFSNYFTAPSYQQSQVDYYLEKYSPDYPETQWNSTGSRGYPDISANGWNYVVAIDHAFYLVGGTSAATPVSAALFTMINDARLAIGKSTIGFINPAIYSDVFAAAFNDITVGSNPGCGTDGFNATVGWDPVTGLGTPNFVKLLALYLLL